MYDKNPYNDGEGKRILRKSFCLYFDILGFRKSVINSDINKDYSFFERYIDILTKELDTIKDFNNLGERYKDSLYVKVFTDNFVIGYPWYDEGEAELSTLVSLISHIQYSFITNDLFIRGAISLGDLHMDDNIVLGKALIEAYDLESKDAHYPRIILSKDVISAVDKYIGYYSDQQQSPQNHYFLLDKDNHYFINYLEIGQLDRNDGSKFVDFIIKHRDAIIRNAKFNITDYNILQKYIWIAEYHNFFVDSNFYENAEGVSDLKIDLSSISLGIRTIK